MLFARTTSLLTILRPASDCFARMLCLYDLQRPPASLSRSLSLSLSFPQCSPQMAYGPGFVFAQLYPGLWGKTGQETAVWIHDKKKSPEFPLQGSKQVETFPLEFSSTLSFVPGLFFPFNPAHADRASRRIAADLGTCRMGRSQTRSAIHRVSFS
jgi:hypothetical protein